jgi:multicomponent Na+:H+ antiporter subunit E
MSEPRPDPAGTRRRLAAGRPRNLAVQAVLLMGAWLILSGHYDLLHLLYGAGSVALVLWLGQRLHREPLADAAGESSIRVGRLLLYLPWLLWQIIASGAYVAKVVLSPRLDIRPRILRFRSEQPGVMPKVILGNSITLTPGTLTLDIRGSEFTIHALTEATAAGLASGAMQAWTASLYRPDCPRESLCADVEHITEPERLRHA